MQRKPASYESNSTHYRNDPEKFPSLKEVDHTDRELPHFSITKSSTDLPPFLKNLFTNGPQEPLNFETTLDDRPEWLDLEKFAKGQKFGRENLISIAFCELFSTFMVWSLEPVLLPFVFAGNITSPFASFKRYASTFLRLSSWVQDDVWAKESNPARKNLNVVNSYHKNFHLKVQSSTREEILEAISLKKAMNSSFDFLAKDIAKDFEYSCPVLSKMDDSKFGINQMNTSIMQFTFVGLTATYPQHFGIHYATDEDLESYVHVWRGLGFLLGIKDEYNFCNCNLEELRKRTKDLIDLVIKPSFTSLSDRWEYIMRCIVDGAEFFSSKNEFESFLLYLFDMLEIHPENLIKRMSFYQVFYFYMLKFVLKIVMKIKYLPMLLNKFLLYSARKSQKMEARIESLIKTRNYSYVKK